MSIDSDLTNSGDCWRAVKLTLELFAFNEIDFLLQTGFETWSSLRRKIHLSDSGAADEISYSCYATTLMLWRFASSRFPAWKVHSIRKCFANGRLQKMY